MVDLDTLEMDILEYNVKYTVGKFEVWDVGGGRIFWRGVRKNGGSDEPPNPLVTGL